MKTNEIPIERVMTSEEAKSIFGNKFVSFYFDEDRDAHADTVRLFEDIAAGKYEAFTSDYVVDELKDSANEKREKMFMLIERYGMTVLEFDQEAEQLADVYVEQGIIPSKYRTDGIHITVASVNDSDMKIKHELSAHCKTKDKA